MTQAITHVRHATALASVNTDRQSVLPEHVPSDDDLLLEIFQHKKMMVIHIAITEVKNNTH